MEGLEITGSLESQQSEKILTIGFQKIMKHGLLHVTGKYVFWPVLFLNLRSRVNIAIIFEGKSNVYLAYVYLFFL